MRCPYEVQLRIIRQPWTLPVVSLHLAAVQCQRLWRGALIRSRLTLFGHLRVRPRTRIFREGELRRKFEADLRLRRARRSRYAAEKMADVEELFREWAATRIQAFLRYAKPRRHFILLRYPLYHIAAMQIQYSWRTYCQIRYMKMNAPSPEQAAATIIERAWRAYTNRRIFLYYRDLIVFRNAGDPAMMLRCINPREASLIDDATGLHVRFRLGGRLFPPQIYYKIYTHNPLCDVNAFAPRDYKQERGIDPGLRHVRESPQRGQGSIRVGDSHFAATGMTGVVQALCIAALRIMAGGQ